MCVCVFVCAVHHTEVDPVVKRLAEGPLEGLRRQAAYTLHTLTRRETQQLTFLSTKCRLKVR